MARIRRALVLVFFNVHPPRKEGATMPKPTDYYEAKLARMSDSIRKSLDMLGTLSKQAETERENIDDLLQEALDDDPNKAASD